MTEQEAIKIINGIDEVRGNLPEDGNDVEIALMMAKGALKEIQPCRKIERDLKEKYHANVDIPLLMQCFIDTIFEKEKHERFCILTNEDANAWDAYKAIGTVEECREAVERQRAKKPKTRLRHRGGFEVEHCPNCDTDYQVDRRYTINDDYCPCCGKLLDSVFRSFCGNCGQAIEVKSGEEE